MSSTQRNRKSRLTSFFRYFGGKKEAARYYPHPRYKTLIEPFAGSAGYSVTYSNRQVRLYDISEYVCGVWDLLINADPKDILSIPLIGEFEHVDDLKVPQEYKWFLGFWLCVGSSAKPSVRGYKWASNAVGQKRGRLESTWEEHTRRGLQTKYNTSVIGR